MAHSARNKRLDRTVIYHGNGKTCTLLRGVEAITTIASRDEAHRWLHGIESLAEKDAGAPTIDEMLDAIAAKLQEDCKRIMLACSESESWLLDMYSRTKSDRLSIRPPQC